MTEKEKAKVYDEAAERAKKLGITEEIFPELKESEDEKIRKEIISILRNAYWTSNRNRFNELVAWLEKQGEQEQLYIRFGEIPTDEKSKIYHGEIEVGIENGVSVYPAFKTNEGDIVLGLNLPITKTTLHTQQHLIEYDNRPCYLVKGDYIGKDTDGQTLINNVSIIEKIDNYRVKEKIENVDNQNYVKLTNIDRSKFREDDLIEKQGKKSDDKVEPKFKVGDWVTFYGGNPFKILKIEAEINGVLNYLLLGQNGYDSYFNKTYVDENARLWTIQDAKDGDVLVCDIDKAEIGGDVEKLPNIVSTIFIFKKLINSRDYIHSYCHLYDKCFLGLQRTMYYNSFVHNISPATKEQRDLLFQKIKETGYEWDAEKKELKKLKTIK